MSFSNTLVKAIYQGNDAVVTFAIPFELIDKAAENPSEVLVILREEADPDNPIETTQIISTNYTLSPSVNPVNVVMNVAPTATQKLLVRRNRPKTQTLDLLPTGPLPAEQVELSFDKLVALVQENCEVLERVIAYAKSSPQMNLELPEPQASKVIGYNENGDAIQYYSAEDLALLTTTFKDSSRDDILDSQGGPIDVQGWTLDGADFSAGIYAVEITRGSSFFTTGFVHLHYKNSTWIIERTLNSNDLDGVTLSVVQTTTVAQVQYTSDNKGAGLIKFKRIIFNA